MPEQTPDPNSDDPKKPPKRKPFIDTQKITEEVVNSPSDFKRSKHGMDLSVPIDFKIKRTMPDEIEIPEQGRIYTSDPHSANRETDETLINSHSPKSFMNTAKTEHSDDLFKKFDITKEEFQHLIRIRRDNEKLNSTYVFMVGVILTPISLIGALVGYARAFNRFFNNGETVPWLYPLRPITRVAMFIGAAIMWALFFVGMFMVAGALYSADTTRALILSYLIANTFFSLIVFMVFRLWQKGIRNKLAEDRKFGSARFARKDELAEISQGNGYYIGKGHHYNDKGHILTVAGTRGGKGTSIIIPNLLGAGNMETSWVVIDPKGENAAITANYQRSIGQDVVILNPWDLLGDRLGVSHGYNPLDMLSDKESVHLVDDVQMIAEMIVPAEASTGKDPFWSDSARLIISGLLLHLVTSQPDENRNLGTLWEWTRLFGDDWDKLIQDMGISDVPVNGAIVQSAAQEILKLSAAGEETFGSIISGVLLATDFLKSTALRKSLEKGFNPQTLADGKTTVYVIIPADKIKSHSRWLRLVVTSLMRAVIRKPNKRVTFLLDEFAALGYLPEIETALSTYAGYNVTVWPILQTLIQLEAVYGTNWESFIANCNVRQYFSINDNKSAEYISTAMGLSSNTLTSTAWFGIRNAEASPRALMRPDEIRRASGKQIFMFVGDLPPTYIDKAPYYLVPELADRAENNPYIL